MSGQKKAANSHQNSTKENPPSQKKINKQIKKTHQKQQQQQNKNAQYPLTLFLPVFWELRTSRKHMDRMIKLEENWLGFSVTLAAAGIMWKPKSY